VAGVVISAAEVNVHGLGPVQGEIACRRSMMPSNKPNRHRTFGTKRSVTIEQGSEPKGRLEKRPFRGSSSLLVRAETRSSPDGSEPSPGPGKVAALT
jgi:hypothetical protein